MKLFIALIITLILNCSYAMAETCVIPPHVSGVIGAFINKNYQDQWIVTGIVVHSPAENAGLKIGDIILQVEDKPLGPGVDPSTLIAGPIGSRVLLFMKRDNRPFFVYVNRNDFREFDDQQIKDAFKGWE